MNKEFFSLRLAQLREKKGVAAQCMSRAIGQSKNYINMIENGRSYPSMTLFFSICEYLDVTPQEFFEVENDNPVKLNELMAEAKKLDDDALGHILEVVKGLANK